MQVFSLKTTISRITLKPILLTRQVFFTDMVMQILTTSVNKNKPQRRNTSLTWSLKSHLEQMAVCITQFFLISISGNKPLGYIWYAFILRLNLHLLLGSSDIFILVLDLCHNMTEWSPLTANQPLSVYSSGLSTVVSPTIVPKEEHSFSAWSLEFKNYCCKIHFKWKCVHKR